MIWGREEGRSAARQPMGDGSDKGNDFLSRKLWAKIEEKRM
jgi:hypothetical protein